MINEEISFDDSKSMSMKMNKSFFDSHYQKEKVGKCRIFC